MINEEQFNNHECHLSPEDGCKTCEEYFGRYKCKNCDNIKDYDYDKDDENYHEAKDEDLL